MTAAGSLGGASSAGAIGQEPWRMRFEEFLPASALRRQHLANYFQDGVKVRSSRLRLHPAAPVPLGSGAWRIDDELCGVYGHGIDQLRWLEPGELTDGSPPQATPLQRPWTGRASRRLQPPEAGL